jgi:hypothetical protein
LSVRTERNTLASTRKPTEGIKVLEDILFGPTACREISFEMRREDQAQFAPKILG